MEPGHGVEFKSERRKCIDTLRGWCLWNSFIVESVALSIAALPPSPFRDVFTSMFTHTNWHGVHYIDTGFPIYIALMAASMVYSYERRLQQGQSRQQLFGMLSKRTAAFLVFAFLFHGGFSVPIYQVGFADIFFELAVAIFISGSLLLLFSTRSLVFLLIFILAIHWALLAWSYVPGYGYGDFSVIGNAEYYMREDVAKKLAILLGFEGEYFELARKMEFYITLPKITGSCIVGLLIGKFLRGNQSPTRQATILLIVGMIAMAVARIWNEVLPINKALWTPSYTLFSAGFMGVVLCIAIMLTEIRNHPRFEFAMNVFGRHPLLAWSSFFLLPFGMVSNMIAGPAWAVVFGIYQPVIASVVQVLLCWGFIYWLTTLTKPLAAKRIRHA